MWLDSEDGRGKDLLFLKNFIGVYFIYNVVLVSGVQQSDSVIHIHVSFLFQIIPIWVITEY